MRKPYTQADVDRMQAEINQTAPLPRRSVYIIERYEPEALEGHGDWWEVRNYQGGVGSYPCTREAAIKDAKYLVSSKYIRVGEKLPSATVDQIDNGFKHRVVKETVSYVVEWESDKGEDK